MSGIRPDNNIGNIANPLVIDQYARFGSGIGPMTSCTYAANFSRHGFECYLRPTFASDGLIAYVTSFAGWSGEGGTTSYPRLLTEFGFNDGYPQSRTP